MEKQARNQHSKIESVVGVLIPTGWNEQFAVTAMALACDGEREIAVANLDEHPEMHAILRRRVRAEGTVSRKGKAETMAVTSVVLAEEGDVETMTLNQDS